MMTYETRTKAVHALRTTTALQICGSLTDGLAGRCANGVIAEALGIPLFMTRSGSDAYAALAALGVPTRDLWRRNDRILEPMSFAEIADWLDWQPVSDPPVIPTAVPAEWTVSKAIAA